VGLLIVAFPIIQRHTHNLATTITILSAALLILNRRLRATRLGMLLLIPVILDLSTKIEHLLRKIPGWDKFWKGRGGFYYDITHPTHGGTLQLDTKNVQEFRKEIQKVPADMRKLIQTNLGAGLWRQDFRKIRQYYDELRAGFERMGVHGVPRELALQRLYQMFPELTPEAIAIAFDTAKREYSKNQAVLKSAATAGGYVARERGYDPGFAAAQRGAVGITNKQLLKAIEHAYKLQKIMEQAPNLQAYFTAWNNFHAFWDKLTDSMNKKQKKMADDLLSAMSQFGTATVSDAAALKMARNIDKLTKFAQKHPTIENWKAVAKAQEAYTAATSQNQQTMNDNILQSEKDIHDKAVQLAKDKHDKQVALAKKTREKEKQELQQAQQDLKSVTDNMMNIYTNAQQQYQSQLGTLFQGPWMTGSIMGRRQQFGFSARPQDLLRDMRMQVTQLRHFHNTVENMRRRGAPRALIEQVQAMGPEAQKQLDTIMKDPKIYKEWVKAFGQGQRLVDAYAKQDLRAQVKRWEKHGKNIALAIAKGIRSENTTLENSIRGMVRRMFPGLAERATPKKKEKGGDTHNHVTYNIHESRKGEGLQSMLRRTHFYYRNRK
jgi:hypothetical protein